MLKRWWKDKFGDLFTIVKVPCEYCGGAGHTFSNSGPSPDSFECEECGGTGEVETEVYDEPNSVKYNRKVTL